MTALPKIQNKGPLYQRPTEKVAIMNHESFLIRAAVIHVFKEIITKASGKGLVQTSISFNVNRELLLKTLPSLEEAHRLGFKYITQEAVERVKRFLTNCKLPAVYPENPIQAREELSTHLQNQHREYTYSYRKIELTPEEQKYSCFDYVMHKLGMKRDFLFFLKSLKDSSAQLTLQHNVEFLISKGYRADQFPLCPNDIIVYYDQGGRITHFVIVDKDPKKVIAKNGDGVSSAVQHNEDETSFLYGPFYQIFRLPFFAKQELKDLAMQLGLPIKHY